MGQKQIFLQRRLLNLNSFQFKKWDTCPICPTHLCALSRTVARLFAPVRTKSAIRNRQSAIREDSPFSLFHFQPTPTTPTRDTAHLFLRSLCCLMFNSGAFFVPFVSFCSNSETVLDAVKGGKMHQNALPFFTNRTAHGVARSSFLRFLCFLMFNSLPPFLPAFASYFRDSPR